MKKILLCITKICNMYVSQKCRINAINSKELKKKTTQNDPKVLRSSSLAII